MIQTSPPPGPYAGGGYTLLEKKQGVWTIVYDGQNATPSSFGFPADFDTGPFKPTVIYTY
jgi:hypothetical protein